VPEFGFAPTGKRDKTLSVDSLKCRPCAIHGQKKCPLKHFDCMNKLTPEYVFQNAKEILSYSHDV
jgi:heptosyltransferase-2